GCRLWQPADAKPLSPAENVTMIFTRDGLMDAANKNEKTLESDVFGNLHASFGGGPGEKGWKQHLACGLPYFALAFIGPKPEAEEIKQRLETFLQDELKLELSKTKTLITHAKSDAAKFLGYEIATRQQDRILSKRTQMQKQSTKCRNINGKIGLRVPRAVLIEKCRRYMKRGRVMHRNKLLNESDYTIIATYQLEFRGIANYYRLAYNLHTLQRLKGVMQQSLAMTLARKHQTSVRKIMNKYKAELVVDGQSYKGLQALLPREGKEPL